MPQALILAGGKGTRLQERLQGRPKPLIDICGVPLLERQILLCKQYGIDHILILVNHAADQIIDFCRQADNWGLSIECIDDGEPRGTAGAVLAVFDKLEDEFLVIYGDTMLAVDLAKFWQYHTKHKGDATLFLHPNDHPQDSDLVSIDDNGRVLGFHPYPHVEGAYLPNLVNAALYVLKKESLRQWRDLEGMQDFGKNVFPLMLGAGAKLIGYNSPEFIKDVGTPKRVDKVEALWKAGRIQAASLDVPQPVVFLDRDGVINPDPGWLRSADQFELLPGVWAAIKQLNASEYRTVVVTNQPVIARGETTREELRNIHNKMDTLLGQEGAYVDRLYFCPHHPDKGFEGEVPELKIKCKCRKPAIGMLEQARNDINADFSKSWVIGDAAADLEMARRAGIPSILVETTPKNLEKALLADPDFVRPDLLSAVEFILNDFPLLEEWVTAFVDTMRPGDVILLGGMAHSGKSTLASVIQVVLRRAGLSPVGVTLDRWIMSEDHREDGVLGRYDMDEIAKFLESVCGSRKALKLSVPAYNSFTKATIADAAQVTIRPEDVVVVDGVIALVAGRNFKAKKIFVKTREDLRLQRFHGKYALRGFSTNEAQELYESRQMDEQPIVMESENAADVSVTLPLGNK